MFDASTYNSCPWVGLTKMSSFLPLLLFIDSQGQHFLQCHPKVCDCPCCHNCNFICPVCLEENIEPSCTFYKSSTATTNRKVLKSKDWFMSKSIYCTSDTWQTNCLGQSQSQAHCRLLMSPLLKIVALAVLTQSFLWQS